MCACRGRRHGPPTPSSLCTRASRNRAGGWGSTTSPRSSGTRSPTPASRSAGTGGFLGKPYEPNAVIKNDIEFILMQRKPGGYRSPSPAARALSVIAAARHREWFRQIWTIPGASTPASSGAVPAGARDTVDSDVLVRGRHGARSIPRHGHDLGGGGAGRAGTAWGWRWDREYVEQARLPVSSPRRGGCSGRGGWRWRGWGVGYRRSIG